MPAGREDTSRRKDIFIVRAVFGMDIQRESRVPQELGLKHPTAWADITDRFT